MRRLLVILVFLLGAPLPGRTEEWLLLRDGSHRTGQLQSCVQDQCRLSGTVIPRSSIAWIGFNGRKDTPPRIEHPERDAVILLDATVHPGRIVGISLGEVTMEEAGFPRPSVAWVWFAGPPLEQPPAQTGAPPPPPSDGTFWTGTLTGRYWGDVDGIHSEFHVTVAVRLREVSTSPLRLVPARPGEAVRTVGAMVRLEPEGTTVNARIQSSSSFGSCSGEGTITITAGADEAGYGHPSVIYRKTVDVDLTSLLGFDVPLGAAALYQVGITARSGTELQYTCSSNGQTTQAAIGYLIPALGRTPLLSPGPMVDPSLRYLEDGGRRMRGSYTAPATGAFQQVEAAWDLTRSAAPP